MQKKCSKKLLSLMLILLLFYLHISCYCPLLCRPSRHTYYFICTKGFLCLDISTQCINLFIFSGFPNDIPRTVASQQNKSQSAFLTLLTRDESRALHGDGLVQVSHLFPLTQKSISFYDIPIYFSTPDKSFIIRSQLSGSCGNVHAEQSFIHFPFISINLGLPGQCSK